VTIKNTAIQNFSYGIYLRNSSFNTLLDNSILDTPYGIFITLAFNYVGGTHHNIVQGNVLDVKYRQGITLNYSHNNALIENTLSSNWDGIALFYSNSNTIEANDITFSNRGIALYYNTNTNTITGNSINGNGNTLGISLFASSLANKTMNNNSIIIDQDTGTTYSGIITGTGGNEST